MARIPTITFQGGPPDSAGTVPIKDPGTTGVERKSGQWFDPLDPNDFTKVYNDPFLKRYFTALLKKQWGSNMMKFRGVKMPGGVELNGREIYDDAEREIDNINDLRVKPSYPFLLQVFSDYDKRIISKTDVLEIMNLIQSYVYRRVIVPGTGTSGHNKSFAALDNHIDKENSQTYVDSIKGFFLSLTGYRRFPSDEEFQEHLKTTDVYDQQSCSYMLLRLENASREKERINPESVSIEHIMPQNRQLSETWQKELGNDWRQIQDKWLHTLGNLTITELNSEMSDKSFEEKKEIAFKNTPYNLSSSLREIENWNKDEIEKRANKLLDLALKVWKFPELSEELRTKYREQIDSDDDSDDDSEEEDLEEISHGWENRRKNADETIIKMQDELIKKIEEQFDCVAMPHRKWFWFYTKEGWEKNRRSIRNCFLVLSCGKKTFRAFYRVDPGTYNNSPNAQSLPAGKGWFFKHGRKTERRMRVGWSFGKGGNVISECLEQIEHAYHTTKEQLNYKD